MNGTPNRTFALSILLAVGAASVLPASLRAGDVPDWKDQLRTAQDDQERLKAETVQVAADLDRIIASFHQAGMENTNDVKTMMSVRAVLNRLSADDMGKVIKILQDARAQQRDQAVRTVAGAYMLQGTVLVQLQMVIRQYENQQQVSELAARFAQLGERQNTNLTYAVQLIRQAGSAAIRGNDPAVHDAVQVQIGTETGLGQDVSAAVADLEKLSKDLADNEQVKAAMQLSDSGKPADMAGQAAESLRGAMLNKAAGQEKNLRDLLRVIARQLGQPADALGQLRQAARELDQEIAQQQQLNSDTSKSRMDKDVATDLETRQAELVDHADQTRKDLDRVAPQAATDVKKAEDQMQTARSKLQEQQKEATAEPQKQALVQLEQARDALAEEINKQLAQQKADKGNIAKLEDLKQEIGKLKTAQDDLKKDTAAAQDKHDQAKQQADAEAQKQLENKTQDAEQKAADASPKAADQLKDAANNMDKAHDAMAPKDADANKAQQQQQSASDKLAQAQQQVDQDLQKLKDDKADEDKLKDETAQLQKIIGEQTKENIDTASAADKKAPPTTDAVKALSQRQSQISDETGKFSAGLPDTAKDALPPLNDAKANMDKASGSLTGTDAKSAVPPQKDALADLYKALAAIAQQVAADQKALDEKPDAQQDMNKLADQLKDAQQQLAQAENNLNQPQDQQNQQNQQDQTAQMQQGQQQVADALKQMAQKQDGKQDQKALQQAQQAAQQAAQQLQNQQLPEAAKSMQQAQDAMQQAAKQQDQQDPAAAQLAQAEQQQTQLQQQLAQQIGQEPPAQELGDLAQQVGQMAAEPQAQDAQNAQQDMQQAAAELADAAAHAEAGDNQQAKSDAQKAQASLAAAQAAAQMAAAGMAQPNPAAPPGPPGTPQPDPGMADENKPEPSTGDRKNDAKGATDTGHVAVAGSGNKYVALPQRDRQAIQQSQGELYPKAYGGLVEQYLRNLNNEDSQDEK